MTTTSAKVSGETVWPAPAKLNLFLHVTGRRADGYHDLQTLFRIVDLCDTIGIVVRDDGAIERPEGAAGVEPEADLVVRAARSLQQATGSRFGATLRVRKRIPQGGGLGGGSSDAATTLLALNALWKTALTPAQLADIGLALGSDVPVFVHGESAWATGRGERLTPVTRPERWYVIVHPGVAVPTASVFGAAELTRNSPILTLRSFLDERVPPDFWRNDCEPVVASRVGPVREAIEWLSRHATARLTGTGACVFAEFARAIDAERVAARVPDAWHAYVARGLDRSPMIEALANR